MAYNSRALCLLVLALALCQAVTARTLVADPTPREQLQQDIAEITALSDNLRVSTQKINLYNAPMQGYLIAQGFTGIITKISEYTARIPSPDAQNVSPFEDADAKLIVQSLTTFVQVHQALLNVVIGKHGLVTLAPFFEPIRVSLVSLESVVDSFAFRLIALIPTQKPAADKQIGSLSNTVQSAISTYEPQSLNSGAVTAPSSLAKQIVSTFQELSALSDNLRTTTESVTVYNAAYRGYKIAQAFSVITARVDQAISLLEPITSANGAKELSDDDAKVVMSSLAKFVQVHQVALDSVIDKHGLVTLVPYVEGIRQALLNLELTVDDFAFSLILVIPTQQEDANEQFGVLGVKLHEAIATYEEPLLNAAVSSLFVNQ